MKEARDSKLLPAEIKKNFHEFEAGEVIARWARDFSLVQIRFEFEGGGRDGQRGIAGLREVEGEA
jgi:hypothetical protein